MRWKYRIAAVATAAGMGIGALVLLPGSAHAAITLRYIARQTNAEFVIDGKASVQPPQAAPSPGDHLLFRDDLLQNGAVIGFDNVDCEITFNNNLLCSAMLAFTNKGDIYGTGLLRGGAGPNGPSVFDVVVTGGTFAYRNAHGDGHAVQVNDTDTSFTLNLVTS